MKKDKKLDWIDLDESADEKEYDAPYEPGYDENSDGDDYNPNEDGYDDEPDSKPSKPRKKKSASLTKNGGKKSSPNSSGKKRKKKEKGIPVISLIIPGIILLIVLIIAAKLIKWNIGTKDTSDPTENAEGFNTEALDNIVPLDATNPDHHKEGPLDILFLGNGQLAEDKDSADNLANIVARKTGATVYNAAIDGSFMSMKNDHYKNTFVYDAYCFYNICTLFTVDNQKLFDWAARNWKENTGEELPANVTDSIQMLKDINYDDIDIICVYYDAQDYFEQRAPHGDDLETEDVHTYSGSFEAGINLIKQYLPDIRIIVLSPTFVYKEKNGEKLSCYDPKAGKYSLETYVTMEQTISYIKSVSFVDNFYGSIHGENADEYLIDNYHLNRAGTELLADRFLYALNRFHEYDFSQGE